MDKSAPGTFRIIRFAARDFRSLRNVELIDLPSVVLLYGENDTGKSNLIQAVGVWLRIVQALVGAAPAAPALDQLTHLDLYEGFEPDWSEAAPPDRPGPRDILGEDPDALFRYGSDRFELEGELLVQMASEQRCHRFAFRVEREAGGHLRCSVLTAIWASSRRDRPIELTGDAEILHRLFKFPWQQVGAERRFDDERLSLLPEASAQAGLHPSGRQVKRALFLAANGPDGERRRLFRRRLIPLLTRAPFNLPEPVPVVGPDGSLQLLIGDHPVEHRGSGPQQWALIAGLLAMSEAVVAGLEEPEAHLSFELQGRIAESLRTWVQDPTCPPYQLFVSTHSQNMTDLCPDETTTYYRTSIHNGETSFERSDDLNDLRARFGEATSIPENTPTSYDRPPVKEHRRRRLVAGNWVRLSDRAVAYLGALVGDKLYEVEEDDGSLGLRTEAGMCEDLAAGAGDESDGQQYPE